MSLRLTPVLVDQQPSRQLSFMITTASRPTDSRLMPSPRLWSLSTYWAIVDYMDPRTNIKG